MQENVFLEHFYNPRMICKKVKSLLEKLEFMFYFVEVIIIKKGEELDFKRL